MTMSAWINAYACKHYNLNCPYRPSTQKPAGQPVLIPQPGMHPQVPVDLYAYSWQDTISLGTVLQILIVVFLAAIFLCLVLNWIKTNGMPFRYKQKQEADVSLVEKGRSISSVS